MRKSDSITARMMGRHVTVRIVSLMWSLLLLDSPSSAREAHALKLKAQREEEDRKLAQQIAANGTPVKGKK